MAALKAKIRQLRAPEGKAKGRMKNDGRTQSGSHKPYKEGWKEGFKKGEIDGFDSMYAAME